MVCGAVGWGRSSLLCDPISQFQQSAPPSTSQMGSTALKTFLTFKKKGKGKKKKKRGRFDDNEIKSAKPSGLYNCVLRPCGNTSSL